MKNFEGKARVLTSQEVQKVFAITEVLTKHPKRNIAMLHCAFTLAMRACEIRRLKVGFFLENDGVTFLNEINLLSTVTKAKKQRHVPFSNEKAKAAIKDYLDERKEKLKENKKKLMLDDIMFPSQKSGFFSVSGIVRLFANIFKKAQIKGARSHSGRRTCLTLYSRAGVPITVLKAMAGHANVQQTMAYIDLDPIAAQDFMKKDIF